LRGFGANLTLQLGGKMESNNNRAFLQGYDFKSPMSNVEQKIQLFFSDFPWLFASQLTS
jgi:hypothetical protein